MKRNRLSSRKRISADATELGRLATGLADSGGKLEEVFWEKQLVELVEKLLQDSVEDDLNASLDRLFDSNAAAHDALAEKTCAPRCVLSICSVLFGIVPFGIEKRDQASTGTLNSRMSKSRP